MGEANLTDDELKEALRSLKPNKSPGYDNISSNVVNETSDIFFTPLKYVFNLSLQQGIFPENLKITKVSPVYKKDEANTFQKIVSFIKNNLVFRHLTALSMLFYYL